MSINGPVGKETQLKKVKNVTFSLQKRAPVTWHKSAIIVS